MRYAAYIEIDGPNRLQELLETLNWAVYDMLKNDSTKPDFDIEAYAVPSAEEWHAGHKNTMTAVAQREK